MTPMLRHPAGSGDLLADRRFSYAESLTAEGDHVGAADLLRQAVELAPNWAAGWLALGRALMSSGQARAAEHAVGKALELDEGGGLGADLLLAHIRRDTPAGMRPQFVAALFDHYAPRFDDHLAALGYRGPDVLARLIVATAPARRFATALDLGCGTGLMAAALRDRVDAMDGIDLSSAMVERARASGLYRSVTVGDLGDALEGAVASYDLVTAADVFVYVGDLQATMTGIARTLTPGGLAAFSVQLDEEDAGYRLGADMRFSHSRSYIEDRLRGANLETVAVEESSMRQDAGRPVPGLAVVARRS